MNYISLKVDEELARAKVLHHFPRKTLLPESKVGGYTHQSNAIILPLVLQTGHVR